MRKLAAVIIATLLIAPIVLDPRSARSQSKPALSDKPDVEVSLAIVERGSLRTVDVLHVIIQNVSDKPQSHFDEWNSWGYGNVSVQWTDIDGKTGTAAKTPAVFSINFPSATVLQPGEALVRDVSFDPKAWQGWPAFTDVTKLTLKAIYHSADDPMIPKTDVAWTGTVTSKEQTVVIDRMPPEGGN